MNAHTAIFTVFVLVSLISLTGLNGCATVDQKITLNYSRQNNSLVNHNGTITVAHDESKTVAKNGLGEWIVGSLNNVHGVHQADLLSDRSPEEWISDALLHELRQAGYTVSLTAAPPVSVSRSIHVSGIELIFNINKGIITTDTRQELKFNVSVFRDGIHSKTFTVASRADRTLPLTASKEDAEKILLQSLQDALQQIIPDVVELIDKQ